MSSARASLHTTLAAFECLQSAIHGAIHALPEDSEFLGHLYLIERDARLGHKAAQAVLRLIEDGLSDTEEE